MLKTPELAMPRSRKVTTFCNGKREVWTDYEEAKAYFQLFVCVHRKAGGGDRHLAAFLYAFYQFIF